MNKFLSSALFFAAASNSFAQSLQVEQISHGVFDCFEKGAKEGDKLCYCETSAVAYCGSAINNDGGKIYFASDKSTPNGSALFYTTIKPQNSESTDWKLDKEGFKYEMTHPIKTAKKYEDFTRTPDKSWIFAVTGFDRVDNSSHKMDSYNTLLVWIPGRERKAQILVNGAPSDSLRSSVNLRESMQKAMMKFHKRDSVPYFKIEGLAAIPGNKLLFGVREMGNSYSDFQYTIEFIQVSYKLTEDKMILGTDWKVVYSFTNTPDSQKYKGLVTPLGLSSMEYDTYGKRLYLLTSHELAEGGNGAYLWTLSDKDFKSHRAPQLVYQGDQPLHFTHKAEDITPLRRNEVFIIHDDDREVDFSDGGHRDPHQAAYSILRLKEK